MFFTEKSTLNDDTNKMYVSIQQGKFVDTSIIEYDGNTISYIHLYDDKDIEGVNAIHRTITGKDILNVDLIKASLVDEQHKNEFLQQLLLNTKKQLNGEGGN